MEKLILWNINYHKKILGVGKIFLNVFKRSLSCSPRLQIFDQKYSKNKNIVKSYYNLNDCLLFEYIRKCNLFL